MKSRFDLMHVCCGFFGAALGLAVPHLGCVAGAASVIGLVWTKRDEIFAMAHAMGMSPLEYAMSLCALS